MPPHLESKHLVRGLHAPHVGPLVRVDGDEEGFEQDVAVLEIAEVLRDDLKVILSRHPIDMPLENPFTAYHHLDRMIDV